VVGIGGARAKLDETLARHRQVTRERLGRALGALEHREWDVAAEAFAEFRGTVLDHMDAEEREMFPSLDAHLGERSGTGALRTDHNLFRGMLAYIAASIDVHDAEAAAYGLHRFGEQFESHDMREELVLFPICERLFSPEQLRALRDALDSSREDGPLGRTP
jgi:hemerythrin superfamily protein